MDINTHDNFLPNTEMFTITTEGFVDFTLNLYASLQRIGLGGRLVVYTPHRSAEQNLSAAGVRSVHLNSENLSIFSDYGTPQFAEIVACKYAVASEILSTGKSVLFVDSDIFFLRNPAKHLRDIAESTSAHLIIQFESPLCVYNAGFWLARPDGLVLDLFADIQKCLLVEKISTCDQYCLNYLLDSRMEIQVIALDKELFACGNQFLESGAIPETALIERPARDFPIDSAYLLHFNYLVGRKDKITAMKERNAILYSGLRAVDD